MNFKLKNFSRVITVAGLKALLGKTQSPASAPVASKPVTTIHSTPKPAHLAAPGHLEDSDEEMRGDSAAANARRRERARCAAIMNCQAAARNPALAANLAFKSSLGRTQAVQLLESVPPDVKHLSRESPNFRQPSLVNLGPQQIADQRLRLAIAQANSDRRARPAS
jgi:hypothetical protein